jgi:hypothetical protein
MIKEALGVCQRLNARLPENSNKHSTILAAALSTHQTKQSESFQKTTIFSDVTSSGQDLKNSQSIVIPYGFYVETS